MISIYNVASSIAILVIFLMPASASADGNYLVGQDGRGMYFQTDHDGSWIIPGGDRKYFKAGERGTYSRGSDDGGTYIRIGDKLKFYLDVEAAKKTGAKQIAGNIASHPLTVKETAVTVKNNRVLLPVTLGHGGFETIVTLILDTGASITTINRDAVKKFRLGRLPKAKLILADGNKIDADLVKLSYIKVGPHRLPDLQAGIIDHKGLSPDYQGLLGMNFLKNVDYKIDFQRQVIIWR